jgi:rare lipoprotein A
MLHWGQAYATKAAVQAKPEKTATAQDKRGTAKTQPNAKAAHAAKSATPAQKHAPSALSQKHKASAPSKKHKPAAASAKHKKHALLPPASADLPQSGTASWVGTSFHGKPVAKSGELHVGESFTAAHRALPFDSILKVTDLNSGRSVLVRVNDRGPFVRGRVIDLAQAAAKYLGYFDKGLTQVRLELAGDDKDPAQRYYIRMRPSKGPGKASLVRGFGPFTRFEEAASLFVKLYKSYPEAELVAVREDA